MNSKNYISQIYYEATRCLQCFDAPCEQVCPVHIPVPRFIRMIKSRNFLGAAEEIKSANTLANICGRICPEEIFCQSVCSRAKIDHPISIRELHDFATKCDASKGFFEPKFPLKISEKIDIAIVGSGIAGISCAFELRKLGIGVDLFDIFTEPGGIPTHVIPQWRMDLEGLKRDLDFLRRNLPLVKILEEPLSIAEMKIKYKVLFLATGLWLDRRLEILGETMPDVYHAIDYLSLSKSHPENISHYKQVVVVGGGNVSLDVATTAKKLGAENVTLTYRRSPVEMKTWKAEKKVAEEVGVQFAFQLQPKTILGIDNKVTALLCMRTQMIDDFDETQRKIAVPDETTRVEIPADAVIVAIGQNSSVDFDLPIDQNNIGVLFVDEHYETSIPGIFAGGDLIRGEGTVVQAVADGQNAAHAICEFLRL